jgi:hypothetical protein
MNKLLVLIAAAGLVLSGCGKTGDGTSNKNEPDPFKKILSKYKTEVPEKLLTPDVVKSERLGDLHFYDGMPTKETTQKVYDNLDFMRGVEVFLNFIPATSIESMRQGLISVGVDDYYKVGVFADRMDSRSLFLTGNGTTVYATTFFDLEKAAPWLFKFLPVQAPEL